ncbi:MAG: hypothetical protein LQ350_005377 [Teloschistes chrysophthalmus]|nr:MAG: hypothetical protein LQ350_005377 [Niorma chrysophthalma]
MFPKLLAIVLAFSTIIASASALAINTRDTSLQPSPQLLEERRYNPLPNPYNVPGTPIILDFHFHAEPGRALNAPTVRSLLTSASAHFAAIVLAKGHDEDIPPGFHSVNLGIVDFFYGSDPHFRMMRYMDLVNVLRGFRTKMDREGYTEREAIVTYRSAAGLEIETGEVDLGLKLDFNVTAAE